MDVFNLKGRAALVTGAGTGIGQAIAEVLGEKGAIVGIHYRTSEEGARKALDRIRKGGGDGVLLKGDLTDENEANRVVESFVREFGRLDILVNNAGSPIARTAIEDCPLKLWREVFDTNMTSAFMVTKRAIPYLKASGKGAIVNIISLSVQTGGANGAGPYAASKGALMVFTRTLARELAPRVRTNSVCPGVIETHHHEMFSTPQRMAEYRAQTPMKRNGTPLEVAHAVLFLVSDAAGFINGAFIDVNGGRFLR
jgi:3-oxoacyl-[acyl-carrier protein] reductase